MSVSALEFTQKLSAQPKSEEERSAVLADPGFGNHFTDHTAVIDYRADDTGVGAWENARIEPYGPIVMDPAAAVLHYGQEIFEGLKAYRHADGSIWTFRPEANAARLNASARRLALPELPEELFLESISQLAAVDREWVPSGDGESLYLRPFMIATEPFLGVRPAREVSYRVIASPAGNYFGGELKPVSIWLSTKYARAGRGGTGEAKCGGNYAASLIAQMEGEAHGCKQVLFLDEFNDNAVEELGGMNVFFVFKDGRLVTPALSGTILHGVTRDSVLQLGRDRGLQVEERKITLDEWRDGVASGEITEVFACGTAAVITPVGELKSETETIGSPEAVAGDVTMSIRQELLGIQTGAVEDTRGWLTRLA
ncbi:MULTISPECIES: branched-chain amino acid aminotransferase [Arthrobacter]|uniref:Branched-chain-amino-acid aminotransferase n=1 Tax=Arthrobacter caoxuetaonis TaxID=2886935 RepID=A0A9X1SDN9_9MICC|nr:MULTISPECIES: branched-chain amino acid aminotransferase [Arthrobacter]MCC3280775.1 branched-chain amino acid aminotransferase [Arthrobacter caoxuetaonis]MCC3296984.1 branched-chain amino acid aminotransferase [Arthrobacter caoxuetaonis]MCC9193060.1 branched-chain amino acid aminotransferase [Arthrobacter sp. zg-Y916]USQ56205.1 branched-chain amino acid aminotransferase [Arthrobacter caoxuetaonis]